MRLKHVFIAVFGLAAICPTQGWSQTADVFPNFGPDKEVVSGADEDFRGGLQCTEYVISLTNIKGVGGKSLGNAGAWYQNVRGVNNGYDTSPTPTNNCIGVISGWSGNSNGHVYWVNTATKSGSEYTMDIRHANWDVKGGPEYEKVSSLHDAVYQGGKVEINRARVLNKKTGLKDIGPKGTWLTSAGFITKWVKK